MKLKKHITLVLMLFINTLYAQLIIECNISDGKIGLLPLVNHELEFSTNSNTHSITSSDIEATRKDLLNPKWIETFVEEQLIIDRPFKLKYILPITVDQVAVIAKCDGEIGYIKLDRREGE